MTTGLQWAVLAVCVGCSLWRLPAAAKGRNRGLFWSFLLVSLAVALSIPAIYVQVDGVLGRENLANVVLRLSLFAVLFLLAAKIAAAYKAPVARRLIRGPVGLAVVSASSAGILAMYFLSELHGSSPGLAAFFDQPTVVAYMWIGRGYQAYVAACLVPATGRAAFSRLPALDRAAALSMCLGFAGVCLTLVVQATGWHGAALMTALSFGSILLVAAGLVLVWVSYMRRPVKH
ncbi:hypothetical protein [Arthrobacter sp. SDTb3-6]|uniref:hypothetical protein n=1 Tax=Arthrobacter sp. SDTb3-6 TaxID=2713571 RepID=UPI00159E4FCE|nr:hypothetical protein [Arthrobacter sp. SDTb3-6]NVM97448.1 hypothetical protein [Arthrobacter sp. SDTb3-6]